MYQATQADVGKHCIYVNPVRKEFDALITAVHGPQCVNVTYVTDDPAQRDNYGQKLVRDATSLMHMNVQQAHGQFWFMPSAGETNKNLG